MKKKKHLFYDFVSFYISSVTKALSHFVHNLEVGGVFSKRNSNNETKFSYHFVACIS